MQKAPFNIHSLHMMLVMILISILNLVWISTPLSFFVLFFSVMMTQVFIILCSSAMGFFKPKFRILCLCLLIYPVRFPDAESELIGKDPDAGKDWGQEEEGATEDEMVGWHHRLNGHDFEQTPGGSKGRGSLACCSPWVRKESASLLNAPSPVPVPLCPSPVLSKFSLVPHFRETSGICSDFQDFHFVMND